MPPKQPGELILFFKNRRFVPDSWKVRWAWFIRRGNRQRWPDLANPRSFHEKLQWLKLNWRDERLTLCADKYRVRDYVAAKAGPEILNELYGVYQTAAEIDFDALPDSFVLKANHGCDSNVICPDKSQLDREAARSFLHRCLRRDFSIKAREWCYKNIPRRILAEKYLSENAQPPVDYKLYCFHGQPLFLSVHTGRFSGGYCLDFYYPDWTRAPFSVPVPGRPDPLPRPSRLTEMLECARRLSADFVFVRVDLFQVAERVVFSELTFYPAAGNSCFRPEEYDDFYGGCLDLSRLPAEQRRR